MSAAAATSGSTVKSDSKSSAFGCRRLMDRVAIVTGGTQGIGFAIAERLAREGAKVMICSRRKQNVTDAVNALRAIGFDESRVLGLVCHVGTSEARKSLITDTLKAFGPRIDILISNVACNPVMGGMTEATDEKAWDKVMDLNVKSAFFIAKECIPHMKAGVGSIVFVASYAAYNPSEYLGAYSVSKTALVGLTKVLAKDVGPKGIRVNCLAPGIIQTAFSEALWKNEAATERLNEIPLRRFGVPTDCAGPVAFLCSDDASYVTGETILSAGGITARL